MARRFTNGASDEIDFGAFAALEGVGAATIFVWLKRRATAGFSHIVSKTASGPSGIALLHGDWGFGDDGIYASVSLAGVEGDLYINNAFTTDLWYPVALKFNGSASGNDRLHLFISGTQQSVSRASTTYPATIGGSGANLRVGGTDHEADVRPSDDIAWLAIWTSALSDAAILALSNGLNPARLNPQFFAPMFGSSSEPDLAGGLSGTVTGTSVVDGPPVGWGAPTLVIGNPASPVTLSPSLLSNTNTFYAPTVTRGAVTLSPSLLSNTNTFYAPTVTRGTVTLSAPLHSNVNSFHAPAVTVGATTLLPTLFSNTNSFYAPVVTTGAVEVYPPLLSNSSTLFSPSVVQGAVTLYPPLLTSTNTFHAPAVTRGVVTLTATLLSNTNMFYAHVVTRGSVELTPAVFINANEFYAHAVSQIGGTAYILPPFFVNTNQFFVAVVTAPAPPSSGAGMLLRRRRRELAVRP